MAILYKRKATGNYKSKHGCFIWGPNSVEKPPTLPILRISPGILHYVPTLSSHMILVWANSTQKSHFRKLELLNKCILDQKTALSTQRPYIVTDNTVPERCAHWHILVFEDNVHHLQAKHWLKDYDHKINIMLLLNCRN